MATLGGGLSKDRHGVSVPILCFRSTPSAGRDCGKGVIKNSVCCCDSLIRTHVPSKGPSAPSSAAVPGITERRHICPGKKRELPALLCSHADFPTVCLGWVPDAPLSGFPHWP